MLLHVFGHVQIDHRVPVAEHEPLAALARSVLPTPDGPTKRKQPIGRFDLESAAGLADRFRHVRDGCLLADDHLVKFGLELEQSCRLGFLQTGQRDTGDLGDHLGDDFFIDLAGCLAHLVAPFLLDLVLFGTELLGLIAKVAAFS